MTEKRWTAAEIWAYCEELERAICAPGASSHAGANYARWGINARTDMPRLLDAAVKLRKQVLLLRGSAFDMGRYVTVQIADNVIAQTIWLEELSPDLALSLDGKNEEREA